MIGDKISRKETLKEIIKRIKENDLYIDTPILSLEETKEYLRQIYFDMQFYHNRNCREAKTMRGLGYLIRKLYEQHMNEDDPELHELFYNIIAQGAFTLQMRKPALARSLYRGFYDAWPLAVEHQRQLLKSASRDAEQVYDDLLSHDDPAEDPANDQNRYPWNMYSYNVDDLILLHCAISERIDIAGKQKHINLRNMNHFCRTKDLICDFFQDVTPYYKARCDYFNQRVTKFTRKGNPADHYNNIEIMLKKCTGLPKEYAPYLIHTCELFGSSLSDHEKTEQKYEKQANKIMLGMMMLFAAVVKLSVSLAVTDWWVSSGMLAKFMIGFVIICGLGGFYYGQE